MPSSSDSSCAMDLTWVSHIAVRFFTAWATREAWIYTYATHNFVCVLFAESCPTLCDAVDYSPPGNSVRGILQGRTLQWLAIPFSRGIFPTQGSNPVSYTADRFFTVWARRSDCLHCLILLCDSIFSLENEQRNWKFHCQFPKWITLLFFIHQEAL